MITIAFVLTLLLVPITAVSSPTNVRGGVAEETVALLEEADSHQAVERRLEVDNQFKVGCDYRGGFRGGLIRPDDGYYMSDVQARCTGWTNPTPELYTVGTSDAGCDTDRVECAIDGSYVSCRLWIGSKSATCTQSSVQARVHVLCC